jgi:hypothetical protein
MAEEGKTMLHGKMCKARHYKRVQAKLQQSIDFV